MSAQQKPNSGFSGIHAPQTTLPCPCFSTQLVSRFATITFEEQNSATPLTSTQSSNLSQKRDAEKVNNFLVAEAE